jgi:predicted murein hydrolase (TIGR00659 family)
MSPQLHEIWVYLAASPLLGLTATLVSYQIAWRIYQHCGCHPLANPVLISIAVLLVLLKASGTDYPTYFEGAKFVHFLLGPATVALAIPLYAQFHRVRAMLLPLALALLAGSLTAIVSAMAIAKALGASTATVLSLAPKSVTTPIAMGITEQLGGIPSLTAVLVIVTGILGAVGGRYLFRLIRVDDEAAQGFAIGLAAHGIGTARAIQMSEQTGAFSALAMSLNGLLTAVLVPTLVSLLRPWL